ncbi:DUF2513 domain-containing protein [Roseibium sp.]|uniref:DUF2513 domain-containing protein n=1 Tax=Roseibium sp. TaxID=1936156 RepID=UPI003D0FC7B5
MKRDMALVRTILFALEASKDNEPASVHLPHNVDDLHMNYHIRLMKEGGLIHAIEMSRSMYPTAWVPHTLTWAGHEFLDAVRDPDIWNAVQDLESRSQLPLPISIIEAFALDALGRKVQTSLQGASALKVAQNPLSL